MLQRQDYFWLVCGSLLPCIVTGFCSTSLPAISNRGLGGRRTRGRRGAVALGRSDGPHANDVTTQNKDDSDNDDESSLIQVDVTPLDTTSKRLLPLRDDNSTNRMTTIREVHPRDLPRRSLQLTARRWNHQAAPTATPSETAASGPYPKQHDNLRDAFGTALVDGFAVLTDADALLRSSSLGSSTSATNRCSDTGSNNDNDDSSSAWQPTATWFQTVPTSPDTTTIPYTEWLPRGGGSGSSNHDNDDTTTLHHHHHHHHHAFAQYLHQHVFSPNKDDDDKKKISSALPFGNHNKNIGEIYQGVLSIGGARRRGGGGGGSGSNKVSPNLQFPHQDECKFSVCMGEFTAAAAAAAAAAVEDDEDEDDSSPVDPLEGLDTVTDHVRQCFHDAFGTSSSSLTTTRSTQVEPTSSAAQADSTTNSHEDSSTTSATTTICRQFNFWCPHEDASIGNKYLVVFSKELSHALMIEQEKGAGAAMVVAAALPRFSNDDNGQNEGTKKTNAALDAVNANVQLTDRAVQWIQDEFGPDHVFAINQPVLFVSHYSRYSTGGSTCNSRCADEVPPMMVPGDVSQAIFHFGAAVDNSPHCSTEMRVALFSSPCLQE